MELKLCTSWLTAVPEELLIVPYGIETYLKCMTDDAHMLLIVPYGIETLDGGSKQQVALHF